MNKWQIICPLASILAVSLAVGIIHERNERNYFVRMTTYGVGRELIEGTNSAHLVGLDADLQKEMRELFRSQAAVAAVFLNDSPSAAGPRACSRLLLTNRDATQLELRLAGTEKPGTYRVLSFSTIANH